jgi:hypothetical protein
MDTAFNNWPPIEFFEDVVYQLYKWINFKDNWNAIKDCMLNVSL